MNCRDARELLVETLSGTTPPDLRREVEAHLASCSACRAAAAALEETATALRRAPDIHMRDAHWMAFMAQLDARLAADRQRLPSRLRRWLSRPRHAWATAGATAAVIVALGAALVAPEGPQARPDSFSPSAAQVSPFLSPQVVDGMPAMNASLAVWKAGLGTGDVSYDLSGGR